MGFLIIGGIGMAVLVVSLLIGEVFDAEGMFDSDIFSIASASAFTGALGFSGAAVQSATDSTLAAIVVGVVVGVVFAAFTVWLTRRVRGLTTSGTVSTPALVGQEARVLTPIPADGYGQVTLRVAGHRVTYSAKSLVALEAGQRVWVSNVLSATALEVSPTDALPPAADPSASDLPA